MSSLRNIEMQEYYVNLFYSVFLHVTLLFIFLTIFFWTVISKTESKSLYSEIYKGIDNTIGKINLPSGILPDPTLKILESFYSGKNQTVERNNSMLLEFNIVIIVFLFLAFLITYAVRRLFCKQSINFTEVIGENILILALVGIIEYFFFMNIASKYVPILPSFLPNVLEKSLNNLIKN